MWPLPAVPSLQAKRLPWLGPNQELAGVDRETTSVAAKVDRLGTFVLYCEVHSIPLS